MTIKEKTNTVNDLVNKKDLCIAEAILEVTDDLEMQEKIANQFKVLASFYLIGSEGWVNLFYREKGAEYYDKRLNDFNNEPYGGYFLQWEGDRDFHSGHIESSSKNLKEAFELFQQRMKEVSSNHRARRSI